MNPSKHKMTVLAQIFKLIPRNLIPKLAKEHGVDKRSRTFSPVRMRAAPEQCYLPGFTPNGT